MGKRAREIRSATKIFARSCGYKETELGELTPVITKAEARRRFLTWKWNLSLLIVTPIRELRALYEERRREAQSEILARMAFLVREEMDAQVFASLAVA